MGVRLYNPTLGRYLQTDPVNGGSANAYDYVNQDPVNADDLTGEASYSNMNSSEKNRCWAHPLQCITYGYVATIASLFGEHYKGGVRNAMRHCAFSALLSYFFSSGTAQAWEAAHEGTLHDIVGNKTGRQRQNAWNDHLIDLQNNVVGNRIGREWARCRSSTCGSGVTARSTQCAMIAARRWHTISSTPPVCTTDGSSFPESAWVPCRHCLTALVGRAPGPIVRYKYLNEGNSAKCVSAPNR